MTAAPAFGALAQRIAPRATLDAVILPPEPAAALRRFVEAARPGRRIPGGVTGLAALFSGPAGTGKSMAAEAIARELGRDLYRVDLAAVRSKYIGETEKNLARVFDAAARSGAVLLFDEADALFGKRTSVRDSHDRYANQEVAYLLQRIEAHPAPVILTARDKAAPDPAFLRRLSFAIAFPLPDAGLRRRIWAGVFQAARPATPFDLDYEGLARLELSGGAIRDVALGAAALAAEERTAVEMRHVRRAAGIEAGQAGGDRPDGGKTTP